MLSHTALTSQLCVLSVHSSISNTIKIKQHLENLLPTYPDAVKELLKSLYVDDLLSGRPTIEKARQLKREAIEIFADANFELHKWHSNRKELETTCQFVQNRVSRIQSHPNVLWRHVPSTDNPADLGSCGGIVVGAELW